MQEIFGEIVKYLEQSRIALAGSPVISMLFSGISHFLPDQNNFQKHHEALMKKILEKRADAVLKFIESVEFLPDSIMEVEDIQVKELLNTLDKCGVHKDELIRLGRSFYNNESYITKSFFFAVALLLVGFFHPRIGVITFLLGVILIIFIFFVTKKLLGLKKRLHELKIDPDLI